MKNLYLALGILAIIAASSLWWIHYADEYTNKTAALLEQAQTAARADDFEAASEQTRQAQALWDEKRGLFGAMLRHQEADDVTIGFSAASEYAEQAEKTEFLSRSAELIKRIEHIRDMETPYYFNVF